MTQHHPIYGLVCTGGGAHGAFQVGVLKYIHEKFSRGSRSPFQVFAGSSCGGLNTAFFASHSHNAYQSRLLLEELWLEFHIPAYHGSILKNAFVSLFREWRKSPEKRTHAWALLDPAPMRVIIEKGFKRDNLETALKSGSTRAVALAATEIISGRTCWFIEGAKAKPWNLFHSLGLEDKIRPQHLEASCSVPIFLPPVKIGPLYYVDGSVSLTKPLSAAMSLGANRILSIGTDKPYPKNLPLYSDIYRPRFSDILRLLLNRLSYDSARDESVELEALNRFHQAFPNKHKKKAEDISLPLFHQEAGPQDYHPTVTCHIFPSHRIRESFPVEANFEEETHGPLSLAFRKRTRFMFHVKFIKELIDMGYRDAQNKHEELEKFFQPPQARKQFWDFWRAA